MADPTDTDPHEASGAGQSAIDRAGSERAASDRAGSDKNGRAGNDEARYGDVEFGKPLSRKSHAMRVVARAVAGAIGRPYFRIEVIGADKLPTSGPVIVAPSHRSNLDTPLIGIAMKRYYRYMAKDSMFKSPFWTQVLVNAGGFPVRRGSTDRRTITNAMEVLEAGEGLVVFPEGARQDGPRILPLFEGAVWLAARAGVRVYPLGIGGTEPAMPIGVKIPRPVKVTFVVGDPLDPPTPAEGKRRVTRSQLDAFASELREAVQVVFDEAQERAGTPNGPWPDKLVRREPW